MPISNDLNIVEQGFQTLNNTTGVFKGRTLTAGANITITNGDGISGNPIIASTGSSTDLHAARYIVSSGGSTDGANYTTIASAYAAAVAAGGRQTVFVQPGTYTENLSLSSGVNISAFNCDANGTEFGNTPNVIIVGTLTATFAGSCSLSGLCLRTNSATVLTVSGANATNIYLSQCYIDATNNNAITLSSSGGSNIILFQCNGNLGTTGIHYFDVSGAGSQIFFYDGWYANTGSSTSVSTISSSGKLYARYVEMYNGFTSSNTSAVSCENCLLRPPGNVGITINGTGTNLFHYNRIESGTASALSVGAGAALQSDYLSLESSNANVITGAGALSYGAVVFTGSSSGVNITTYTAYSKSFIDKANTSTGVILRSDGTNFVATTSTYPATTTSQQILYSTAANVVGQLTTANSSLAATNSSGTLAMRAFSVVTQVFTSTGTYTPTAGMLYCIIEVVGGGGGSGGTAATSGSQYAATGGGGGGEYARGVFSAATIGASQSVTIGAVGAAGTAGNNPGGTGGTTSVGSTLISGIGGSGSSGTAATGGTAVVLGAAGGTGGTGGDFRIKGGPGLPSIAVFGAAVFGGNGGSSFFGGGAIANASNSSGNAGQVYGSGGSGASSNVTQAAGLAGSTGAKGLVVVTEYVIA